jgi:hypothetical protein
MSKDRKLLIFTLILSIITIALTIYRYEKLLKTEKKDFIAFQKVIGGTPLNKEYSAEEIINLIKTDPGYLGDSITIFENGEMLSSNNKFQGTINAVLNSKENMNIVTNEMKNNKLPIQYNVYKLAAVYYRQQYKTDSQNSSNF